MSNEPKNKFERFRQFAQKIVFVPKTEMARREEEYRKSRKMTRKAKS